MGRFTRSLTWQLVLIICLFCIKCYGEQSVSSRTSKEDLVALAGYSSALKIDQDYSCLTTFASLEQKLASFQLIDTRLKHSTSQSSIKNAWIIPVPELKTKLFLKKKSLLLIGDGFSRANSARDCAILKKAGFSAVKILVGGSDVWQSSAQKRPSDAFVETVDAQQLLYEYFNGRVAIVATSTSTASKLTKLGITNFYSLKNESLQQINDIVISKSNSGFDPIVVVSDKDSPLPSSKVEFPNLYRLAGGVDSLQQQLVGNIWINHNRTTQADGVFCGKK